MTLSIIIVNWNSTVYLAACLASIFEHTTSINLEVIVIDNGSSDDTCSAFLATNYPQVTLICSSTNLGFSKACNLGFLHSSGDALLFLNPDTEIENNVFSHMFLYLLGDDYLGAVGPRLLNSDGSLQTTCVQAHPTVLNQLLDCEFLRRSFPRSALWGMRALSDAPAEASPVAAVSGASLMVKRHVYETVGGFDERYFMYVEDLDLCRRISKAGFRVDYLGNCEVVHHGGRSSAMQGGQFVTLQQKQALLQHFQYTRGSLYADMYRICLAFEAGFRLLALALYRRLGRDATTSAPSRQSLDKWFMILRWTLGLVQ